MRGGGLLASCAAAGGSSLRSRSSASMSTSRVPRAFTHAMNVATGSRRSHSSSISGGTYVIWSCSACPRMRMVTDSMRVGPPPLRARRTASRVTSYTAARSVPSTRTPGMP